MQSFYFLPPFPQDKLSSRQRWAGRINWAFLVCVIIATMQAWQKTILLVYGLLNLCVFAKGLHECKIKKNAYGLTPFLFLIGVFVWGDAVIFGPFWVLISLVSYLLNDWILFLLILSLFWVVRSLGETIYWFNQQFSKINRQPPEKLSGYRIFHDGSVWFAYQIFNQCIMVVALVFSIYLSKLWLQSKF